MARSVTLFTGQWADLSFETVCRKAREFGYDGLELCCWGDHFEVPKALEDPGYCEKKWETLKKHDLTCHAISNHLVGQAICDQVDGRHKAIVPDYVWGDGNPEGVSQRAADEMIRTGEAAVKFGVKIVNGFTGSSIWPYLYSFPPVDPGTIEAGFSDFAERFTPIMDAYRELGIRFGLEVHPTEIAFDISTAEKALEAINYHESFGFNYDPSHLGYQGVDYIGFIRQFGDRIFHAHMKDVYWSDRPTRAGVFGGHLDFGNPARFWDFRSLGRGSIDFEEIIRAFNEIGYFGPLSVEWEDAGMDREHGASEAVDFLHALDFEPSKQAFDSAFARD